MKKDGVTPQELFPKCVKVDFRKEIILNAVGLSGPGAKALFETGQWQKRTKPFFVSFMSVAPTPEERILETHGFVELFAEYLPKHAPVGLQINFSCPNVGLDTSCLVGEAKAGLEIASVLGVPLMPKFNILAEVNAVKEISKHPACDAVCVSNTIPWDKLPEVGIDRKKLFGTDISPLAEFGGGGLSGAPLLPLVVDWLKIATMAIRKPINAGGGILSAKDVDSVYCAGANSIFVGSVATLHPRRVQEIIRRAHQLFRKENTE